jgi:hypothetical protein
MTLLRLAFLVALSELGSRPADHRPVVVARSDAGPAALALSVRPCAIPVPSPHAGLSRLPAWRYRIKSVLEDKVAWCPRPVDRGPLELPDLIHTTIGIPTTAALARSRIPLRC